MAALAGNRLAGVHGQVTSRKVAHKQQVLAQKPLHCISYQPSTFRCSKQKRKGPHEPAKKGPLLKIFKSQSRRSSSSGFGPNATPGDASLGLNDPEISIGDGGGQSGGNGSGHGGNGDNGAGDGRSGDGRGKNTAEALSVLSALGRSLESIPADLAYAINEGRISKQLMERYLALEQSFFARFVLGFAGFRERLLADELFLTKVAIECGVGVFTKTAAELERRREKFTAELDFVIADVLMALIADFMLVWLPAPTISLRAPPPLQAGRIARFFFNCPDNAFQIASPGVMYSVLQRVGAIVRNGAKLFVVGTGASLVGTVATNGLIFLRHKLHPSLEGAVEAEDLPILATSAAYGAYMAVSSNLRYQVVAGVIEQRVLEPLLHKQKFLLGASSFVIRTGNTFLGSLMWVDYARLVGIQGAKD